MSQLLDRGLHPVARLNESAVAVNVTGRITVVSDWQVRGIECPEYCALTKCCRLAVVWEQVLVNPETKADVWVHDEIEDCTARYMCVLVDVALAIGNLCNSTHWIYDDTLDAVRCTWMNVDEHE